MRYYLSDADSGRPAWPVPRLAREASGGEAIELELDERLHDQLEREAQRQRVQADVLAAHALMYFLADYETGRAAARLGATITRDAEAN